MIELTQQQRQAVSISDAPVQLVDPETHEVFVLVRSDLYEKVKGLVEEEFQPRTVYPAVDRAFAEGWNDPSMDDYDRYEGDVDSSR
jgi:hypothetical protein